jgi:uncharacterized protein DUF4242
MTTRRLSDSAAADSLFLVERYLPATAAGNLAASVARLAQRCASAPKPGAATEVQYLYSAYLPAEDTCFCLFRASTAAAVSALNDETSFALDRITAAVLLHPLSQESRFT